MSRKSILVFLTGFTLLLSGLQAQTEVSADSLISTRQARILLLKSALLPGWGEHSLGLHRRGYVLNGSELVFWIGYAAINYFGHSAEKDMQAYAARHAGIDTHGKDIYYYTDIGNYLDIYAYNEQKLRYRQFSALYPETPEYFWAWDSDAARRKFDKQRYNSQQLLHAAGFALGGLVLNRIVSMIDVIALTKDRLETPPGTVRASLLPQRAGLTLALDIEL
ncbi:MAG: hypothetical protein DRG58_04160 [Deltaproteobacteria bacterium]|nr:MAG: hypothetical protein DRG58_04160 [Deltaproteobacteria bacterium]